MERKIFSWDGWDQHDTMVFSFSKCVFVSDFGPFKVGDKSPYITMDYDNGLMQVYSDKDNYQDFDLRLALV